MANKIQQITIGDALIIELDNNPVTDGVGYNAPNGSYAYYPATGEAFVKLSGNQFSWHTITNSFLNGGNFFSGLPTLTIGSLNDKNFFFIRNNVQMMAFITNPDPEFKVPFIRFTNNEVQFVNHTAINNKFFNRSLIISNTYSTNVVGVFRDLRSMVFSVQGDKHDSVGVGVGHTINPNQFALPDNIYKVIKREVATSKANVLFSGAPIDVTLPDNEYDWGDVMFFDIDVMGKNVNTGDVVFASRRFAIKVTDSVNKTAIIMDKQNLYDYASSLTDKLFDFDLNLSNFPNSVFQQGTNTFSSVVSLRDLTNGETYSFSIIEVRRSMQLV